MIRHEGTRVSFSTCIACSGFRFDIYSCSKGDCRLWRLSGELPYREDHDVVDKMDQRPLVRIKSRTWCSSPSLAPAKASDGLAVGLQMDGFVAATSRYNRR